MEKTIISYQVRCGENNGTLSPEGLKGYSPSTYGIEECRRHIKQIRETAGTKGEYKDYWKSVPLHIERVVTVTTRIESNQ